MIDIIRQRLNSYTINNVIEEDSALKEIVQEIILFSLWDAKFFEVAAFQGGTSLRILHGLPRFSEDIDFILIAPDQAFGWSPYLELLTITCRDFGIEIEALAKSNMDKRAKKAVIKNNSIANQLNLAFVRDHANRKISIKLEIDCDPPTGSGFDYSYLNFPIDFEVCHQDLSSNFALNIHALLCREYLKGRDWFDFSWYLNEGIKPNLILLQNALIQYGPWKGEQLNINIQWLSNSLREKISSIGWSNAIADVERFLKPLERKSLSLWSERFFQAQLKKLQEE